MAQQNDDETRSMKDINNASANFAPRGFHANAANFEIKGALLSNLPKFYGLAGNDAYKHLDTLYLVCSAMKPPEANLDDVLLRIFHFSMEGGAKEWLHNLPTHYATLTWDQLQKAFLDRYFPVSKLSKLRKSILGVLQHSQESLYEYWMRYMGLINSCPNHQCSKTSLVQYFYDGLIPSYKINIDAAANGSIFDLTPIKGWELLETMANSNQQAYSRDSQGVVEVAASNSADMLTQLLSKMDKRLERLENESHMKPCHSFNTSQALVGPSCNYCASPMHTSETCPTNYGEVAALYQNRPNSFPQKNPFSNTYNESWREHPNFRWRDGVDRTMNENQNRFYGGRTTAETSRALVPIQDSKIASKNDENMVKVLKVMEDMRLKLDSTTAASSSKFASIESKLEQWETKSANLGSYVTQIANTLNDVQVKIGGVLPFNTVINPKSLNAITLRSGRQVKFAEDQGRSCHRNLQKENYEEENDRKGE